MKAFLGAIAALAHVKALESTREHQLVHDPMHDVARHHAEWANQAGLANEENQLLGLKLVPLPPSKSSPSKYPRFYLVPDFSSLEPVELPIEQAFSIPKPEAAPEPKSEEAAPLPKSVEAAPEEADPGAKSEEADPEP